MTKTKLPSWVSKVVIWLIVAVGAFYRFYNLNWDGGFYFHPDERNIAVAVGKINFFKALNPEFFAYNGFWIYLSRIVAGTISFINHSQLWLTDWGHINLITRSLSAVFSSLSIYLTYLVAKKLMSPKAGLVAAFLSAFSVGYIQYAHYGVTESLLVFWVLLITLLTLNRNWTLVALVCGLSVATKTSALTFIIIPLVTFFIDLFDHQKRGVVLLQLPKLLFIFTFTVFICSPFSFLDWGKFRESMNYESGVVDGTIRVPYTLQFLHTQPYLYFFTNLFWTLGPLIPVFGGIGLLVWVVSSLFTKKFTQLPFLFFGLSYFAYVGNWYTKFIRYLLPIYPVLIISTVWLLFTLLKRFSGIRLFTIFLVLIFSFLWSTAYLSIYTNTSTRIDASKWVFLNLPSKSTILTEHWDDRVPIDLPNTSEFNYVQMTNYDEDSLAKIDLLANNLTQGDYLVLSSRRLYGSIGNAPDRYPITAKYYNLLFGEKLGYVLLKNFTSYPRLGPVIIDDNSSEETFQVYDHPVVSVFINRDHLSPDQLKVVLSFD